MHALYQVGTLGIVADGPRSLAASIAQSTPSARPHMRNELLSPVHLLNGQPKCTHFVYNIVQSISPPGQGQAACSSFVAHVLILSLQPACPTALNPVAGGPMYLRGYSQYNPCGWLTRVPTFSARRNIRSPHMDVLLMFLPNPDPGSRPRLCARTVILVPGSLNSVLVVE